MIYEFETLSELILKQAENKNPKALNFKESGEWRSFSSEEFLENSVYFACGLKALGFKKGDKFGVYSYQNPIWLIVDFGVILAQGISVPIFHNVSKENLLFQIEHSEIKFIFSDYPENFDDKNHFNKIDCLKNEVSNKVDKIISYGFDIEDGINFDEILEIGKRESLKYFGGKLGGENAFEGVVRKLIGDNNNAKELATIIYTSGSTGRPKGVELSHENLVSQIKDASMFFPLDQNEDKILSFLPLAHIFERMVMMYYIISGASIYFVDDVKKLGEYLKEVRPTLMTVVPRMLEKVFAKIKDKSQDGSLVKKFLASKALNHALNKNVGDISVLDFVFNGLVYKKYRQALGGNMRMIICGGAALSQDLEKFYQNIGVNVLCGYGLTEASPVLAANNPDDYRFSTVGKSFNSVELKIGEGGELLAKGKNIMIGYHKDQEKTDQTIIDGWLKTGDLAEIDDDGFVKITGRAKELFKTANGKYVRPVPLEQKIVQEMGFLLGAIIIAEGRNFVSVLLFPDFENISGFKDKMGFKDSDEEFLKTEKVNKFVEEKMELVNKSLDRSEQIFKFEIICDEISIESGAITPSMKLKRSFLENEYKDVIDGFYV